MTVISSLTARYHQDGTTEFQECQTQASSSDLKALCSKMATAQQEKMKQLRQWQPGAAAAADPLSGPEPLVQWRCFARSLMTPPRGARLQAVASGGIVTARNGQGYLTGLFSLASTS